MSSVPCADIVGISYPPDYLEHLKASERVCITVALVTPRGLTAIDTELPPAELSRMFTDFGPRFLERAYILMQKALADTDLSV